MRAAIFLMLGVRMMSGLDALLPPLAPRAAAGLGLLLVGHVVLKRRVDARYVALKERSQTGARETIDSVVD